MSLFSTSPVQIASTTTTAAQRRTPHATASNSAYVQPSTSAPAATRFVAPPAASSSSRTTAGSASGIDAFFVAQSPHSQPRPHTPSQPHHQRKKSVPWIPDSLAERCYNCHASFSLVLRRHHCRRCGNVFCDACSSGRIPLVSAGFFTPVRVCEKCCIAAKKAHAKMVEEQQQRHHPEIEPYQLFPQASRDSLTARSSNSSSSSGAHHHKHHQHHQHRRSSLPPQRRRHRAMTESVAHASGMFFQPAIHRSRTYGDSADDLSRRLSAQYGSTDHLYDDRELEDECYRMQMLPGEVGLECSENVRIRFLERVEHVGTLYITNYRIVFSPYVGALADAAAAGKVGETSSGAAPRFSADLSVNAHAHVKEDELPYASDLQSEALHAYQAIPIVSVERLKKKEMAESDSGLLDIVCKDFRHVQFVFAGLVAKQTFSSFDRTHSLIRQFAFGDLSSQSPSVSLSSCGPQPRQEFAKVSMETFTGVPDGWKVYNPVAEFQRMGVSSSSRWRISQSNQQYALCPTYPSLVAVPATVSDSVLATAAKFRSKSRIPVLSWRDTHTGAVICRSSQPLVGLSQKQCDKDVFLIQAIAAANPSSSKLVIIDARPWKNAVAQKTVGRAGYELTDHYETRHATASLKYADMVAAAAAAAETSTVASSPAHASENNSGGLSIGAPASSSSAYGGDDDDSSSERVQLLEAIESSLVLTECKLVFMGIENIHAMRKSYNKLLDACVGKQSNDKWLDQLDATHWLEHTSRILESAVEIVRLVKEQRASVLIHCSDGWDRTAQLTSLAQLMLDPYYRTVQGFEVLIEKEWCSFGHKFRDRTGHGLSNASSEISPVFLQWIDCVWQLLAQFPSSFQFNERFLILILDHLYACRFGTFLYNSEKLRVECEATEPTVSLWTYLNTIDRTVIENPFYHPHEAPRKKWKASVTATRQCFEIPVPSTTAAAAETDAAMTGVAGDDSPPSDADPRFSDGQAPHHVAGRQQSGHYGADSLVHTDSSSQLSVSLSSGGYESDNSESREHVQRADLDAFIHDMHTELGGSSAIKLPHSSSSSGGARHAVAGSGDFASEIDSDDADDADDDESSDWAQHARSSCFHKIVRDLDAGFSFPQPVAESALSNFQASSPRVVRSTGPPPPLRRSRSSSSSTAAAAAATLMLEPATPPTRPSLSSLFTPMGGRASEAAADAMWNASEADAMSESDEQSRLGKIGAFDDVIVPCCAIKALHFWTRYYLRWDPAANFGRDASVEVETLHRDLQLRFGALQSHVDKIRQEEAAKWRRKLQRLQAARAGASSHIVATAGAGGTGTGTGRLPATSVDDDDDDDEVFRFDDARSFSRMKSPQHEVMRPKHVDVVHLSLDQLLKDENRHATAQSAATATLEEQIVQLEQQRQASLALAEQTYQDSLARLLRLS